MNQFFAGATLVTLVLTSLASAETFKFQQRLSGLKAPAAPLQPTQDPSLPLAISAPLPLSAFTASDTYYADHAAAAFDGVDAFGTYESARATGWEGLTGGVKVNRGIWITYCSGTGGYDEWVQVDFEQPVILSALEMRGDRYDRYRQAKTFQVLIDQAGNWSEVGTYGPISQYEQKYDFGMTTAETTRLRIHIVETEGYGRSPGCGSNDTASIYEAILFGSEVE